MHLPRYLDSGQDILRFHHGANLLCISSINQFYKPVESTGFAIKYVSDGIERYTIEKEHFAIQTGFYLLMNGHKEGKVYVENQSNVKGICVSIDSSVIGQVIASHISADTAFPDADFGSFFDRNHYLTNQYQSHNTSLGNILKILDREIKNADFLGMHINDGLFYTLAQRLVEDQVPMYRQLQSVRSIKVQTRRDLYKRLWVGRRFIDAHFTKDVNVARIAQEAGMSDYHFFRLFKSVFGVSPYQYILQKRLEQALFFIKEGKSASETAFACGFSDVFSFSKSFKKRYGFPPSKISSF